MDYTQSKEDWWNSQDFDTFRHNYQHLCGVIDSCCEGQHYRNFQHDDIKWLDKKTNQFLHFNIQLKPKHSVPLVPGEDGSVKAIEPPPNYSAPTIPLGGLDAYIEDGLISFDQFDPVIIPTIERDMSPSDRVLCQAYLELLDAINGQLKFRRCQAGPTTRRPACQNIFRIKRTTWSQKTLVLQYLQETCL